MTKMTASAGMPAYLRLLLAGGAIGAFAVASPAYAAGTQAGTAIKNVATATYDDENGDPVEEESNEVEIIVDEVLDVLVEWEDTPNVGVDSPSEDQVLEFSVTNAGNGEETFDLSAVVPSGVGDFDPTTIRIYVDNGDGVFDSEEDTETSSVTLDADEDVAVFILANIPEDLEEEAEGHIDLTATAATKTDEEDPAGTIYAGQGEDLGDGAGDAVVGDTTARDTARGTYEVTYAPPPLNVAIVKSHVVSDDPITGGSLAIPGATITYTLSVAVTGTGTANNLVIADTFPTGTSYVEESMKLGSADLTDTNSDEDGAEATSTGISVDLGDVTAAANYTITFDVTIDEE